MGYKGSEDNLYGKKGFCQKRITEENCKMLLLEFSYKWSEVMVIKKGG